MGSSWPPKRGDEEPKSRPQPQPQQQPTARPTVSASEIASTPPAAGGGLRDDGLPAGRNRADDGRGGGCRNGSGGAASAAEGCYDRPSPPGSAASKRGLLRRPLTARELRLEAAVLTQQGSSTAQVLLEPNGLSQNVCDGSYRPTPKRRCYQGRFGPENLFKPHLKPPWGAPRQVLDRV